MRVFFDSSAFAKRYISETGTDKVLAWCDQATEIGLSAIALPEIISAFCRLRREGEIDAQRFKDLTGLTRKFSIPLLEYFDRIKLTIRIDDRRVLRKG